MKPLTQYDAELILETQYLKWPEKTIDEANAVLERSPFPGLTRKSWRSRLNLDNLIFWGGVIALSVTVSLSLAKSWQNFWMVTEWSQVQ